MLATADQTQAPGEPGWRFALRLLVDLLAWIAFSILWLALCAGLVGLVDLARVGVDGARADLGALRGFPGGLSRESVTLVGFLLGLLLYVAVILAIFALARLRRGRDWRAYVAWRPFRPERAYALLAVAGVIWGVGVGSVIENLRPETKDWFVFPRDPAGIAASFALVALVGPLAEEFVFRGWLFTALRPRLGAAATVGLTAILFALAHWEKTHLYAAAVFPVGLLLGYARERSGSMRASFAFHGFYNFAGWLLAAFAGK